MTNLRNKVFVSDNANDLYKQLIKEVSFNPEYTVNPRGLECKEILDVVAILTNPNSSWINIKDRKLNYAFSIIEMCEYLYGKSDTNRLSFYNSNLDFVKNKYGYTDGAYAERLNYWFRHIVELLKNDKDSRQAVATIYGIQDRHESKDVPCTLIHQYTIRDNKLNLTVHMRSNDLLWGFPYDIHAFCFLQRIIASILGVEVGTYTHIAGSLHIYTDKEQKLIDTLECEEYNDTITIPIPSDLSLDKVMGDLGQFFYSENLHRNKLTYPIIQLSEPFNTYSHLINNYIDKKHGK